MPGAGGASNGRTSPSGRVLLVLLLAYIFNFVDRQIIGILAVPIQQEFGLEDDTLGLLGVVFGIFYATIALPIAWLADRKNRVTIIAVSIGLWSLFTAACGMAQNFTQLVLARMGVAFGEAGGIAPSYSLIADFYPKSRRARALAFFSLGIPIGSALGIFFGGWLTTHLSWQAAFLIVGLAGLPTALLVWTLIREPVRGGHDDMPNEAAPPAAQTARVLAANPSFWLLSFGAAAGSILGYGLIFWLPSFFKRSFGLTPDVVGWYYGSIVLVGGVAGTWLGGWLGDRLGPGRPAVYALIPACCFLVTAPAFALGLFAPNLWVAWILFTLGQMTALAWLGPVILAVQHIVQPAIRATASASFLFINNLIGIAFGIYFLGWLSKQMKAEHGDDSLQYSILYGLGFYLVSAAIYFVAAKRLKRDWVA